MRPTAGAQLASPVRGAPASTVANSLPTGLDLAVVELGYNDNPATFPSDIDAMMSALTARGVQRVVWVNMADIRRTDRWRILLRGRQRGTRRGAESLEQPHRASTGRRSERQRPSDRVGSVATASTSLHDRPGRVRALAPRRDHLARTPTHYLAPPRRIELPVVGESLVPSSSGGVRARPFPTDATGVALNVADRAPEQSPATQPCGRARTSRPVVVEPQCYGAGRRDCATA